MQLTLLVVYWLIFASYIDRHLRKEYFRRTYFHPRCSLKRFLLIGVMKFPSVQRKLAYLALLVVGAFEFSLPIAHPNAAARRRRPERGWRDADARRRSFTMPETTWHPVAGGAEAFMAAWDQSRIKKCFAAGP